MPSLRCFTPQDTELYERGYPHLVILIDDPKRVVPVAKVFSKYYGAYRVEWPRSIARGFVRAAVIGEELSLSSDEAIAAAARTDDIDRAEARALIRTMLARKGRASQYLMPRWVYCLEALVGTDTVLELLANELAALPANRYGIEVPALDDEIPSFLAYCCGYLLLRASAKAAASARTTLEALWNKTVAKQASLDEHSLRAGLDLALHGMEGARRILPPSHWQYLCWWGFVTDPAMLLARFADNQKADFIADARLAWTGGPSVLEYLCQRRCIHNAGDLRLDVLQALGKFDHPAVAAAMAEWKTDKRVGEYAIGWLAEHGRPTAKSAPKKPAPKPAPKKPAPKKPAPKKPRR